MKIVIIPIRCGHCKAMEPEYKKLAKWMKKIKPNLLVAKMDATANDVHIMFGNLKGYPTIFFLPMDNKEQFIQYQDESFTFDPLKVMNDYDFMSLNCWCNETFSKFA